MTPQEHLRLGDLPAALDTLQAQVRADPGNAEHRTFLFQLLCVMGDWERALAQLTVAGELDAGSLLMVQIYRDAIRAEPLRSDVFAGNRAPLIFGEPEQWVALLLEALKAGAAGRASEAADLRAEALEQAPASPGQLDGKPFEWLADSDPRLGPMLEAIVNGRYYWIPVHHIAELRVEAPADLRDLVWVPARFKWTNGGDAVGLLPARYPGSERSADSTVKLGRRTEWLDQGNDVFYGLGQRMLLTDAGEYPLLEVREVLLGAAGSETASAGADR